MKLTKVSIHKYKSFLTEQTYEVESQITRIVGKNESGKTALLEALAKSNYFEDNADFQFDKDLDYPRSELTKVRTENPKVLTCEYELSDEDVKSVEDVFAEGIISKQRFSVTSYYDNTRTTTGVSTDFGVFKDWLISAFGVGEQGKELIHAATDYPSLVSVVSENNSLPGMVEQKIIADKKILYYHSVIEQTFADIEDLFSKEEYLALYNGAFGTSVQISDLDANKPIMSQLKRLNGNKSFNHYSPANYMAKNIGTLSFSEETIGRFEKLFSMVNSKFD